MLAKTFVCGMILFVLPTQPSMKKSLRFCSTLRSLVIKVSATKLNLFFNPFFSIYFQSDLFSEKGVVRFMY